MYTYRVVPLDSANTYRVEEVKTGKREVLGLQKGSRTLITFEKQNFFSLVKKLYTAFLKRSPYKSRVFGQNRFLGIHGLTLGFRGLITFVGPNYFLTRNISFIHENPVSFHFRPPPIQIFEKTGILPLLPKYWSESVRSYGGPNLFFDNK